MQINRPVIVGASLAAFLFGGPGPVAGAADGAAVAHRASGPHITATPKSAMVNTSIKLVGRGWARNRSISLAECGTKSWIAPQNPCNKTLIHLKTGHHGGFRKTITAKLCPRESTGTGGPATQETCYIGRPVGTGVDVIDLRGAVKITVTYP